MIVRFPSRTLCLGLGGVPVGVEVESLGSAPASLSADRAIQCCHLSAGVGLVHTTSSDHQSLIHTESTYAQTLCCDGENKGDT